MTDSDGHEPIYETVRIGLPRDATFHEAEELLESIADRFAYIEVSRINPRAGVGGPVDPSLVQGIQLAIVAGVGVGFAAFAKRFMELFAEDAYPALRRAVVASARRIAARRGRGPSIHIYFVVDRKDESGALHQQLMYIWPVTTEADLRAAGAAALEIPGRSLRRSEIYLEWDASRGAWKPSKGPWHVQAMEDAQDH